MSKDIRKLKTYEDLYNLGWAAIGKLDDRANEETDVTKRRALRAKRSEIRDFMYELRNAQLVELTTPTTAKPAGEQLRDAVKKAKREMRKLEDLATALKAATDLLNMAQRLVKLVL